ncbi:unnamed protein product [Allacma fusca]|uniref:Carboxylesterase type B domain-containing protein n=1 Tax=Allacma fusca TaxID=39272 RepID=A0A8J2KW76_9HEXA|nr:unnamed protein product [Allacma fusca]
MVECLRGKSPVALVSAQFRLLDWVPFPIVVFAPVIEPESPEAFLTITPQEFYAQVNGSQGQLKPWIFGMTSEEGYLGLLFLRTLLGEKSLRHRWSQLAPTFLDFKYTARDPEALANKLATLYFQEYTPKYAPNSYIAQLFGDRLFLHGVFKAITLHSHVAPTFAYYFQYKGKYNAANLYGYNSDEWGVGHTEDLYYYFNSSSAYPGFKRSDREYQLSHILTTFLTTFAKHGEPLMTTDDGRLVKVWDLVSPSHPEFLRIDNDIRMIPRPMEERFALWDQGFSPAEMTDLNLM